MTDATQDRAAIDAQAFKEFGIILQNGRWFARGGEVTAPIWSMELQRNLVPPWWPYYVERDGTVHDLA